MTPCNPLIPGTIVTTPDGTRGVIRNRRCMVEPEGNWTDNHKPHLIPHPRLPATRLVDSSGHFAVEIDYGYGVRGWEFYRAHELRVGEFPPPLPSSRPVEAPAPHPAVVVEAMV